MIDDEIVTAGAVRIAAAKDACSANIDRLVKEQHLAQEDAYMLMSVCGDLRITEIVDMPNWVVAFYFPRVVFN